MGTSTERHAYLTDFYKRGHYVPGLLVDGMDFLKSREAARWAKNYCSTGNGPLVLEFRTYRYHGHSMSDPGTTYRSRDEVSDVRKKNDPIERLRALILEKEIATADDLKNIEKDIR